MIFKIFLYYDWATYISPSKTWKRLEQIKSHEHIFCNSYELGTTATNSRETIESRQTTDPPGQRIVSPRETFDKCLRFFITLMSKGWTREIVLGGRKWSFTFLREGWTGEAQLSTISKMFLFSMRRQWSHSGAGWKCLQTSILCGCSCTCTCRLHRVDQDESPWNTAVWHVSND